jgi:hypothetical protein
LLRERAFHLFTDHRNLQYIFDPHSVDSTVAKYRANKLQRWSMVLQMFRYEIEYIRGEDNVWGDLLSRWASRPPEVQTAKIYRLVYGPLPCKMKASIGQLLKKSPKYKKWVKYQWICVKTQSANVWWVVQRKCGFLS